MRTGAINAIAIPGDREVLCRRESKGPDVERDDSRRASLVRGDNSRGAVPASARCNKQGPGIYASAGSCIASRRGRGIRLIILIAPSTPFLCGKCLALARSLARSLARALPSRALNFMPLAAICTYKQTSESSCGAIRASVCVRTGGSHKRTACR